MDVIDRKICGILQDDGRISSSEIAERVGVAVSTANERVRRLLSQGAVTGVHAQLDPNVAGAGLCVFVFVDMAYDGEADASAALAGFPEVMELHHISGAHSYLMKLRVADSSALQSFLRDRVKPLPAVHKTETILSLEAIKESLAVRIGDGGDI